MRCPWVGEEVLLGVTVSHPHSALGPPPLRSGPARVLSLPRSTSTVGGLGWL